jgi:hypothetical protein
LIYILHDSLLDLRFDLTPNGVETDYILMEWNGSLAMVDLGFFCAWVKEVK